MDIAQTLHQLGIHRYESAVYVALLELGPSNAGPIITRTQLHRVFVYGALEKLQNKKLVSVATRRNRKVFQAVPPTVLLDIEKKRISAVEAIIPHLIRLSQSEKEKLEIRVLYGKEEFYSHLETVVKRAEQSDKIMRIMGGGSAEGFETALDKYEKAYLKLVRAAGIKKRMIAPHPLPPSYCERFIDGGKHVLRLMNQGLSSPTYTRITRGLTGIEIYMSEIVVIQIWNEAVADGFIEHFDLLWKKAKPYRSTV